MVFPHKLFKVTTGPKNGSLFSREPPEKLFKQQRYAQDQRQSFAPFILLGSIHPHASWTLVAG